MTDIDRLMIRQILTLSVETPVIGDSYMFRSHDQFKMYTLHNFILQYYQAIKNKEFLRKNVALSYV